jgi:peptidoglycan/xylan/chitin deacetylase (PgdA/CDA1 family)
MPPAERPSRPAARSGRVRRLARGALASAAYALGLTRPERALAGRLTIVTLHRVLPPERRARYPMPHLAVPPRFFDELLAALAAAFDCRPLHEAVAAAQAPRAGGRPLLALTFDDGMRDNFEFARPLLARHRVRATFFAVAENAKSGRLLGHDRLAYAAAHAAASGDGESLRAQLRAPLRDAADPARVDALAAQRGAPSVAHAVVRFAKTLPDSARARLEAALAAAAPGAAVPEWEGLMDLAQLRALAGDGHEIGSHSMTHALLRSELAPDFERETAGARALLREATGAEVRSFCYPDGAHDGAAVAAVRAAGYSAAVTTRPGTNRPPFAPFELARVNVEAEPNEAGDGSLSFARLLLRLHPRVARGR